MLLDRRACLRLAASVLPFARPNTSPAAGTTIAFTSPELQYLEPIYELKFSLDALRAAVENPTPERITALRGRLKRFFGGPLSEQYVYRGLCIAYQDQIKYAPQELAAFVDADKQARSVACDDIIGGMRSLKDALDVEPPDPAALKASADVAVKAMKLWLSYVPPADVAKVDALLQAVRVADTDRNGKLSDVELGALSDEQAAIWRKVRDYVG